ncbi:hypothetical protein DIPPA_10120 [Diplonema papillatum]|nr:hypothetical protein DIPPA_10120 [Diplonema papillatum]
MQNLFRRWQKRRDLRARFTEPVHAAQVLLSLCTALRPGLLTLVRSREVRLEVVFARGTEAAKRLAAVSAGYAARLSLHRQHHHVAHGIHTFATLIQLAWLRFRSKREAARKAVAQAAATLRRVALAAPARRRLGRRHVVARAVDGPFAALRFSALAPALGAVFRAGGKAAKPPASAAAPVAGLLLLHPPVYPAAAAIQRLGRGCLGRVGTRGVQTGRAAVRLQARVRGGIVRGALSFVGKLARFAQKDSATDIPLVSVLLGTVSEVNGFARAALLAAIAQLVTRVQAVTRLQRTLRGSAARCALAALRGPHAAAAGMKTAAGRIQRSWKVARSRQAALHRGIRLGTEREIARGKAEAQERAAAARIIAGAWRRSRASLHHPTRSPPGAAVPDSRQAHAFAADQERAHAAGMIRAAWARARRRAAGPPPPDRLSASEPDAKITARLRHRAAAAAQQSELASDQERTHTATMLQAQADAKITARLRHRAAAAAQQSELASDQARTHAATMLQAQARRRTARPPAAAAAAAEAANAGPAAAADMQERRFALESLVWFFRSVAARYDADAAAARRRGAAAKGRRQLVRAAASQEKAHAAGLVQTAWKRHTVHTKAARGKSEDGEEAVLSDAAAAASQEKSHAAGLVQTAWKRHTVLTKAAHGRQENGERSETAAAASQEKAHAAGLVQAAWRRRTLRTRAARGKQEDAEHAARQEAAAAATLVARAWTRASAREKVGIRLAGEPGDHAQRQEEGCAAAMVQRAWRRRVARSSCREPASEGAAERGQEAAYAASAIARQWRRRLGRPETRAAPAPPKDSAAAAAAPAEGTGKLEEAAEAQELRNALAPPTEPAAAAVAAAPRNALAQPKEPAAAPAASAEVPGEEAVETKEARNALPPPTEPAAAAAPAETEGPRNPLAQPKQPAAAPAASAEDPGEEAARTKETRNALAPPKQPAAAAAAAAAAPAETPSEPEEKAAELAEGRREAPPLPKPRETNNATASASSGVSSFSFSERAQEKQTAGPFGPTAANPYESQKATGTEGQGHAVPHPEPGQGAAPAASSGSLSLSSNGRGPEKPDEMASTGRRKEGDAETEGSAPVPSIARTYSLGSSANLAKDVRAAAPLNLCIDNGNATRSEDNEHSIREPSMARTFSVGSSADPSKEMHARPCQHLGSDLVNRIRHEPDNEHSIREPSVARTFSVGSSAGPSPKEAPARPCERPGTDGGQPGNEWSVLEPSAERSFSLASSVAPAKERQAKLRQQQGVDSGTECSIPDPSVEESFSLGSSVEPAKERPTKPRPQGAESGTECSIPDPSVERSFSLGSSTGLAKEKQARPRQLPSADGGNTESSAPEPSAMGSFSLGSSAGPAKEKPAAPRNQGGDGDLPEQADPTTECSLPDHPTVGTFSAVSSAEQMKAKGIHQPAGAEDEEDPSACLPDPTTEASSLGTSTDRVTYYGARNEDATTVASDAEGSEHRGEIDSGHASGRQHAAAAIQRMYRSKAAAQAKKAVRTQHCLSLAAQAAEQETQHLSAVRIQRWYRGPVLPAAPPPPVPLALVHLLFAANDELSPGCFLSATPPAPRGGEQGLQLLADCIRGAGVEVKAVVSSGSKPPSILKKPSVARVSFRVDENGRPAADDSARLRAVIAVQAWYRGGRSRRAMQADLAAELLRLQASLSSMSVSTRAGTPAGSPGVF